MEKQGKKQTNKDFFYEKQIYDLKQLLEISKSLNSVLDFSTLIEALQYTCMGQMKTLGVGIFIKKSFDSTHFQLNRNYYGFELLDHIQYCVPETHPLIGLLNKENTSFTLQDLSKKLKRDNVLEIFFALKPSLIVPLKAKNHINGILILGEQISSEPYSDYEKEHILNIASLAAIAISNATLLEMTTTDMMTHLRLKHYFFTVLVEKLELSATLQTPVSVLMLDIDYFKQVNDTYGHAVGDTVLQTVASIIQQNTRAQDMAARYGGEEFVVMLNDTTKNSAIKIAERIRTTIEKMKIRHDSHSVNVTISIGVALFNPDRDKSAKHLVDRADKALYNAKQSGRNRVSFAN